MSKKKKYDLNKRKYNPPGWACNCDDKKRSWILTKKNVIYKGWGKSSENKGIPVNAGEKGWIEKYYEFIAYIFVCEICGNPKTSRLDYKFVNKYLKLKEIGDLQVPLTDDIIKDSNRSLFVSLQRNKLLKDIKEANKEAEKLKEYHNRYFEEKAKYWKEEYKKYLQSMEWQKKRDKRLEIDDYYCQKCGKIYIHASINVLMRDFNTIDPNDIEDNLLTNAIHVHHKSYKNVVVNTRFKEWIRNGEQFQMKFNENINDELITLCDECHYKIHNK